MARRMKGEQPEGFERLWAFWYPHSRRSDGPGKARDVYAQWLASGASPDEMYDGAQEHIRTMKPEERPYIQLLSVYLNSERWKMECQSWRAYQRRLAARQEPTNVIAIKPKAVLPDHHFLNRLARGEVKVGE